MAGDEWYVAQGTGSMGLFSTEDLRRMAGSGELKPDDMLWKTGMQQWVPARSAKNLFPTQAGPPPLPSEQAAPPPVPPSIPPPLPSPSRAPRPDQPASDGNGVELAEAVPDDEVELAEAVPATGADPRQSRTGATRPRRTHATQAGTAGIPPWAKVGAGLVAAIVAVGILVTLMGGSSGPSGGNASPPAVNPSPPVDPRALSGTWTYSGSGPDGLFYEGEMILNRDGSFALAMSQTTAGGQRVSNSSVGGTWSVNGRDLVLALPDPSVGAPMVKSIVAVDAGSLTVQNVDTGVVSRWLRGSGKARVAPSARQPSPYDGGTGGGRVLEISPSGGQPAGRGRRAPASAVCPACKGTRGLRCFACTGTGFDTLLRETCTVCRGTGIMTACHTCNGTGKKPSVGRPLSY